MRETCGSCINTYMGEVRGGLQRSLQPTVDCIISLALGDYDEKMTVRVMESANSPPRNVVPNKDTCREWKIR